jgi:23S rRNA pseudouridine1911/1915/1917 synthase
MPRQALHAKTVGFYHPIEKKKMFFNSELPDDMKLLLKKLRATGT